MSTEHTLAENLLRLQSATEDIADAITEKGGTASYSDGLEAMGDKIREIPNPQPVLTTKTIIQNGTYRAEDDEADGYSEVSVHVSNSYTASDEGKVVSNGALVTQGSDTVTENGTVDTTLIGSLTVNVESGGEIPKQKSTKPDLSGREFYGSTWTAKTWSGLSRFYSFHVWTDGDSIYLSNDSTQYVLNKSTSSWSSKSWSGLTNFYGQYIWTDGDNIYYSEGSNHYVLNKSTSVWTSKTWSGLTQFYGEYIWTDGDNIYYSEGSKQYVLNKSTSKWTTKTWSGLTSFSGYCVWTDGYNIYYSSGSTQYVLDKSKSTWSAKTWSGLTSFGGRSIWTDGDNIYYSYDSSSPEHYALNKLTSIWTPKTWSGLTSFNGFYVWTDGDNIYYSNGSTHYVLNKQPKPTTLTTSCKVKFNP